MVGYQIDVPFKYTKNGNKDHIGIHFPVDEAIRFSYGTAGFRANAQLLTFVVFRVGLLAGLRARFLNKCVGVMITASHNPGCDNGVKIIDPSGSMLEQSWEMIADHLINCSDANFVPEAVGLFMQFPPKFPMDCAEKGPEAVLIGHDTRVSSEHLVKAACAGVQRSKAPCEVVGLLTTPQLHYIVRCRNHPDYGAPSEQGYFDKLRNAFDTMFGLINREGDKYKHRVHVDCANGVGGYKFPILDLTRAMLTITTYNSGDVRLLNSKCGADFVKIANKFPSNLGEVAEYVRCASVDGDADRLVYFFRNRFGKFELIDGDKIAALFAKFTIEQLALDQLNDLTFCVVQTPYANGNSTAHLKDRLGVNVVSVATGTKNLQREASKYDIGLHFEANGHGTIHFSNRFYTLTRSQLECNIRQDEKVGIRRLLALSTLLNTVVGDAIADLLAVELILRHYDWSVEEWSNMYHDLPNCQFKVEVKTMCRDRFMLSINESRCIRPEGLQTMIDSIVRGFDKARAFVRPSGTENVVRIYAEAAKEEDVYQILRRVQFATLEVLRLLDVPEQPTAERQQPLQSTNIVNTGFHPYHGPPAV